MAPPQRQVAVGWASFLLGFNNTFMQPADALGMGCPMSDRLLCVVCVRVHVYVCVCGCVSACVKEYHYGEGHQR